MRRFVWLWLLLAALSVYGQDHCAFDVKQKKLQEKNPYRSQPVFENWLQLKINQRKASQAQYRTQAAPYKIPVVVHVIHNGENDVTNIPDAQILSQIKVLNNDYQRLNADAAQTPAVFLPVAASIDLEFVLAKQDPDGLPTNGIVRVRGSKAGWTEDDEFLVKSQSYWPSDQYLNIWVVNQTDSFIGYAQFPPLNLPGLDGFPTEALTDGVVIDYRVFGSIDDGNFNLDSQFNKGRTATHEVGHYLGLLHTFEGGCTGPNDYVTDTPALSSETRNCPSHPATSCNNITKMFQNYLDYTNDACMNLFTAGQIDRVINVLENSPRRKSLLTSPGLQVPVLASVDLEARSVQAPATQTCSLPVAPVLEVRNRGSQTITNAVVALSLNGTVLETKTFALNLASLASTTLTFDEVTLPEPSSNELTFTIQTVNGAPDNNTANNQLQRVAQVAPRLTPPLIETLNELPVNWTITNPDNGITWGNVTAPAASSTNKSMYINFYDYEAESYKDFFASPFIDLGQSTSAVLKFDRAYARFPGRDNDSLRIRVFAGCTQLQSVTLFNQGSAGLATANTTNASFKPTNASQWRTEAISLNNFLGQTIQVVFEATNGYGNNLYLDEIQIVTGAAYDLAAGKVLAPAPVICDATPTPAITIQNLGSQPVAQVRVTPVINGIGGVAQTFTNLNLASGAETQITLNPISLGTGNNTVQFVVSNPEATDELPDNNSTEFTWVVEPSEERIPFRQRWDGSNGWTLYAPAGAQNWELIDATFGPSAYYGGFTNAVRGDEAWVVSPVLDFSGAIKASMFFDLSYARRNNASERLRILVSEDCGVSYPHVLFDQSGDLIAVENNNTAWQPQNEGDWRNEFVVLNNFAGKDQVRVAFVVTNDNGNNLYLDNIEFFEDDNGNPPRISELYTVYSSATNPFDVKVTFNLPEKEQTRIQVFTVLGQLLVDETLPETLNQTYTIDFSGQQTGIYIARLQVGNELRSFKMFVGR